MVLKWNDAQYLVQMTKPKSENYPFSEYKIKITTNVEMYSITFIKTGIRKTIQEVCITPHNDPNLALMEVPSPKVTF